MDSGEQARLDLAMSLKRKRSSKADGNLDAALSSTYFFFQIEDWNWTFSFGTNEPGDIDGPYFDYRQLEIKCSTLGQLGAKVSSASIWLLPMRVLDNNDARRLHNSNFVGRLELKKKQMNGSLYLPSDVLHNALQMMIAGKWRYIVVGGRPFESGYAAVKNYRLQAELDEDDLSIMARMA